MDDRDLAAELDTHLYDHAERVDDCPLCRAVMRHMYGWFTRLEGDPWLSEYALRVDERGWMVILHRRCGRTVAEWPDAQGMWPLAYDHLLGEATIHEKEHHR